MFTPRSYTILLVTFDCIARIDLQSRNSVAVTHSSSAPRSEFADLATAVRTGLGFGPAKHGRIFVLCDEIWAGQVSLANEIVTALRPDELEPTLALQAEQLSGISPFESRSGQTLLESNADQTTWWVTQAELVQLDGIVSAISNAASQLVAVSSISTPPARGGDDEAAFDLAVSPQQWEAYAVAWLSRYLSQPDSVAVIDMQGEARAQRAQRLGPLTTAATMLLCLILYFGGSHRLSQAQAQLATMEAHKTQLRSEFDRRETFARERQKTRQQQLAAEHERAQQLAAATRQRAERAAARRRPVQLLWALAETAAPEHCIQRIELRSHEGLVSGVAFDSQSVTSLAQRLEAELGPAQWQIRAAEISRSPATRLVNFEMRIVPRSTVAAEVNIASSGAADAR